jgi:hypothetical protein
LKKNHHKNRAGGVAQDVGPDFKPNTKKKKKISHGAYLLLLKSFAIK